ncbi:hypothetical protein GCK72_024141 [Caenorhabditis remanei]|uniref:Uncharacterized protein n=1 Tax=Caenorhabditis remanei TaxID=31234 RepID=A0A6A5FYY6_CAERE|nr:hypothetical protein GCK72_024141 [Caenorhabditis remanei]KAF1747675.1 hypothetical protein GCK72_024141 [Caenorhabditis remanei]
MVSPKQSQQEDTSNESDAKKMRKKKGFRGETVADRLLASARRMQEMRISENGNSRPGVMHGNQTAQPNESSNQTLKLEKLGKATNEIDDLSALEWETSSEQSGI